MTYMTEIYIVKPRTKQQHDHIARLVANWDTHTQLGSKWLDEHPDFHPHGYNYIDGVLTMDSDWVHLYSQSHVPVDLMIDKQILFLGQETFEAKLAKVLSDLENDLRAAQSVIHHTGQYTRIGSNGRLTRFDENYSSDRFSDPAKVIYNNLENRTPSSSFMSPTAIPANLTDVYRDDINWLISLGEVTS